MVKNPTNYTLFRDLGDHIKRNVEKWKSKHCMPTLPPIMSHRFGLLAYPLSTKVSSQIVIVCLQTVALWFEDVGQMEFTQGHALPFFRRKMHVHCTIICCLWLLLWWNFWKMCKTTWLSHVSYLMFASYIAYKLKPVSRLDISYYTSP